MKRDLKWLLGMAALVCCHGCSWIDDIGTVEKKGSYTFSRTAGDEADSQTFTGDALRCLGGHESGSFDVFTVHEVEHIWIIQLYDEVRDLKDAVILTVNFVPWAGDRPDESCPGPDEVVGTGTPVSPEGCVRAYLSIGTCSPAQTYQVEGTLTLTEFSTERRETVAGSIEGRLELVRIVDDLGNSGVSVTELGDFSADFQFPVHVGAPWRR